MLNDNKLEKESSKYNELKQNIWGRYDHVYNWFWDKEHKKIAIIPTKLEYTDRTAAVLIRDQMIAQKLKAIGIQQVLDVGSDTGHLIATLASYGIDAVGVDSSNEACSFIESKGVNHCYKVSIQNLITLESLSNNYDCLVCLNITQAKWADEQLKKDFIIWVRKNFKYAILSDLTNQDKNWDGFKLVHQFTIGRFKYNKVLQFVYRVLGTDPLIHYSGIQKLYKINK